MTTNIDQSSVPTSSNPFPPGFLWGSGTAAYQIEGAWDADGKQPSVWDHWTHSVDRVTVDGTSGDTASDQYHHLDEDLDLLADLDAPVHRFSIAWPRVIRPDGTANPEGLDYYERFVDGLADRGIAACVTLFHWDTPQAVEDAGGWVRRDTAYAFADYVATVADRLADRVAQWFTFNEPVVSTIGGYVVGAVPPHRPLGADGLVSVHHHALAHGLSVAALRAANAVGQIGTTLSLSGFVAATDDPADVEAARRAEHLADRLFLEPMLRGRHLPELVGTLEAHGAIVDGDLATMSPPIDLLGVNWYASIAVAAADRAPDDVSMPEGWRQMSQIRSLTAPLGFVPVPHPDLPWTATHRQITHGGLSRLLAWIDEAYPEHPPFIVTENGIGLSEPDPANLDDAARIDYTARTLMDLRDAIDAGVDVRGYYHWSLMDNLQWMAGFTHRFGLVRVDPATFERSPKASFRWYRDVVAANGVPRAASG